ncbi:MAG: radical SAM protein [Subdoligranulum sp.]|nr:radical SAM protein [Subdoligranulum sp.]
MRPLIIAHRGASHLAPENTLTAFRLAKTLGADGFECDVQITRDRHLVVAHDYLTDLKTGVHGNIPDMDFDDLRQLDFVSEVFRLAHAKKVQTALDTSAQPFAPDNADWMARFDKLLENTDLVILDLKEIDDEKHKKLTGHSNKNILAMAQYVASKGVDLWIRHVLVPGLTDDADGLRRLDAFIKTLPTVRRVEILPYHTLGLFKWQNLGIPYPLDGVRVPTAEEVAQAEALLHVKDYPDAPKE